MGSVDDRVVNMQFNNREFEKNTSESMNSLDKLKKSLDFKGAGKSLDGLKDNASKFSLSGMTNAVEHVGKSFTAMSAVAFTVIQNITNRAVDMGLRIVKNFSFGSIMDGFREYETNLNSIQTVLANTQSEGATLDNVNDALQQLNTYADQTIYNFSEMARNIGTFTAAGVKLDTSVKSIKGIANLAAIAGSNSQQASTAMYQLSQAISSGAVKLQDWNSVVNAGMGGKVFQEALFETGKAMGTISKVPMKTTFDQWTKAGNNFRESLKDGWITSEVLTTTLEGFTGDLTDAQLKAKGYNEEQIKQIQKMGQMGKEAATKVKSLTQLIDTAKEAVGSGWTQTWQIVFGDFEEAKTLFTGISDVLGDFINKSADARNQMLGDWKKMGGRTVLLDALKRTFEALMAVITPIKDAFREIFPKKTGDDLFYITSRFREFTKGLMPSAKTIDNLKRTFVGLFTFLKLVGGILAELGRVVMSFFQQLDFGNGSILDVTASIGDFLVKISKAVTEGGALVPVWQALYKGATVLANAVNWVKDTIVGLFDGWNADDAQRFTDVLQKAKDVLNNLFGGWNKDGGGTGFSDFLDKVKDKLSFFNKIGERIGNVFRSIKKAVQPLLNTLSDSFKLLWDTLKDSFSTGNFSSVLDIFNTAFLGGIVLALKKFLSNGVNFNFGDGILKNISKSFDTLTGTLQAMQTSIKANALLKIAGAVGILTASVLVLSTIDSEKLKSALVAMAAGFAQLLGSMAILVKISGSAGFVKVPMIATSMILLSTAVLMLSGALKILATMSWDELGRGLAGLAGILAILSAAIIPLSQNSGRMLVAGAAITELSIALNILYFAVNNFSKLDWLEMAKGLAGVAGVLGAVAAGMALMPKGMVLQSAALVGIAAAVNALYFAVSNFSGLNWTEMGKGLAGVAGSLTAIAIGMKLMPKGILLQSAALNAVGLALLTIGKAVSNMGGMSWEEIGKGLATLAGSLGILAGGLYLMSGTLAGSAAISVASVGIMLLAKALKAMGNLSWEEIGVGLVAMAGSLAVIGVAGLLVTPIIPGLIALGIASLGLGVGLGVAGLGLGAFMAGLSALAAAGPAGVAVIMTALQGFIEFIPMLALKLGEGIINFIGVMVQNGPVILAAFVGILDMLLEAVIKETPKIVEAFGALLQGALQIIRDNLPDIIETGLSMLQALLQGISDHIPEIVTTVIDIIAKFLQAIADNLGKIIDAGVNIIVNLLNGIANRIGDVIAAGSNLVTSFISGLSKMVGDVIKAGTKFITDLITGIGNAMSEVVSTAVDVALAFLKSIADNTVKFVDAGFQIVIDLMNGIADAIRTRTSELMEAGWNLATALIDGIIDGIGKLGHKIWDKISGFISNAWDNVLGFFGISSPSKKMRWVGEMMMTGWGIGIDKTGDKVISAIDKVTTDTVDTMTEGLRGLPSMLESAIDVDPTITPVLDLSKVEASAARLNGMMNVTPITAAASYGQASQINAAELAARNAEVDSNSQNGSDSQKPVINLIQNNTSPKALSEAEIYRQTKNLMNLTERKLDEKAS